LGLCVLFWVCYLCCSHTRGCLSPILLLFTWMHSTDWQN